MSSRTLDYLISVLGAALSDLNLIATALYGGMREFLPLPEKELPDPVRDIFEAGQNHLIPVQYLSDPSLLNAEDIISLIRGRIRLMQSVASK